MKPGRRFHAAINVAGSRSTVGARNPIALHAGNGLKVSGAGGLAATRSVAGDATYRYQLRAIVEAVRGGTPTPTSGADSVRNVRAIDEIYRAAGL